MGGRLNTQYFELKAEGNISTVSYWAFFAYGSGTTLSWFSDHYALPDRLFPDGCPSNFPMAAIPWKAPPSDSSSSWLPATRTPRARSRAILRRYSLASPPSSPLTTANTTLVTVSSLNSETSSSAGRACPRPRPSARSPSTGLSKLFDLLQADVGSRLDHGHRSELKSFLPRIERPDYPSLTEFYPMSGYLLSLGRLPARGPPSTGAIPGPQYSCSLMATLQFEERTA